MQLVLASGSPRRKELLAAAGVRFIADAVPIDEQPLAGEAPHAYVARLAVEKARATLARRPDALVLGADTTVVVDGQILGKPVDDQEATTMLRQLSGRSHEVLTGVAVVAARLERTSVERTTVWVSSLSEAEIRWYVASGEPRDRAGAYAIQGLFSRFVPRVDGSYTNVVGLPVATAIRLLGEAGVELIPA